MYEIDELFSFSVVSKLLARESVILLDDMSNGAIAYNYKHLGLIHTGAIGMIRVVGVPINKRMDIGIKSKSAKL